MRLPDPLWTLPAAKLVLHLATIRGYGLFRDEFYYVACSKRLALELLKLNVEYYPESARAWGNLGSVYARQEGEIERAVTFLRKALELDPGYDAAARKLAELRSAG